MNKIYLNIIPQPSQRRLSVEQEDASLEHEPANDWLIREAGSRGIPTPVESMRIPRSTLTSLETPLVVTETVRLSLVTELRFIP